jgi:hypothetical protein
MLQDVTLELRKTLTYRGKRGGETPITVERNTSTGHFEIITILLE